MKYLFRTKLETKRILIGLFNLEMELINSKCTDSFLDIQEND